MMNKQSVKNIGIIGFGNRSTGYAETIQNSLGGKINISAVADPEIERSTQRLKEFGLTANLYASASEMAEKETNIDGFIICSPDNCHLESFQAIAHLQKPLLFEKPLEGCQDNFIVLENALEDYPAEILVAHCMRHAPILKKAKELIDAGNIGKVTSMRFVQNCHYGDNFFRNWFRRKDIITSLFVEKGTHDFDIMHMMNGDSYAESVFAFSQRYKFGGDKPNDLSCLDCPDELDCPESIMNKQAIVPSQEFQEYAKMLKVFRNKCVWAKEADIGDDEMCMIKFSNGVQGSYIQTFYTPRNYSGRIYTIIGTEGVLEIDLGYPDEVHGRLKLHRRYGTQGDSEEYNFDYLGRNHYNGDVYLVRNFLGVLQGTEKPWTTVKSSIAAAKLGFAAARSAETGSNEKIN